MIIVLVLVFCYCRCCCCCCCWYHCRRVKYNTNMNLRVALVHLYLLLLKIIQINNKNKHVHELDGNDDDGDDEKANFGIEQLQHYFQSFCVHLSLSPKDFSPSPFFACNFWDLLLLLWLGRWFSFIRLLFWRACVWISHVCVLSAICTFLSSSIIVLNWCTLQNTSQSCSRAYLFWRSTVFSFSRGSASACVGKFSHSNWMWNQVQWSSAFISQINFNRRKDEQIGKCPLFIRTNKFASIMHTAWV